jgi:phosphoribosylamine--glycine ligase / phosphoribosylformylglycinamidine cyclo-ligase
MSDRDFRILLIGSGGREHAIAWKLAQSPTVEKIFVLPGNGGKITNIDNVDPEDYPLLVELAQQLKINLVVPGSDVPVVNGIEGYFRKW